LYYKQNKAKNLFGYDYLENIFYADRDSKLQLLHSNTIMRRNLDFNSHDTRNRTNVRNEQNINLEKNWMMEIEESY
jgi:hypothetical protein